VGEDKGFAARLSPFRVCGLWTALSRSFVRRFCQDPVLIEQAPEILAKRLAFGGSFLHSGQYEVGGASGAAPAFDIGVEAITDY
jgi:hypothetical protein